MLYPVRLPAAGGQYRPPWASPPTTPTPSAVSSKTGGRSKGGIGGGYRARGIRPPLGFQPAAAAASFSFKLSQLLRSFFSSFSKPPASAGGGDTSLWRLHAAQRLAPKPSPLRQGEGKRKLKRARLALFNLSHAFGLLLVHRRLTYPTIRLYFLKFIKPKSGRMLPFRKDVLCCY